MIIHHVQNDRYYWPRCKAADKLGVEEDILNDYPDFDVDIDVDKD